MHVTVSDKITAINRLDEAGLNVAAAVNLVYAVLDLNPKVRLETVVNDIIKALEERKNA